jgi:threonine dehydrogenase-like Zn-dependent dehydrogenase
VNGILPSPGDSAPTPVCAVDIDDGKLALAKQMGADFEVNAKHADAGEAVKKGTNGGAHGVLITAPSLSAFRAFSDQVEPYP